ncbi:hypothetical protein FBU30_007165 [Linnemannia zychae]|nr:hypothetical protein FBU30_007165 [Linnemannia zychae]
MVKTKSGGGFGATVSSTRWNRYGTFATQLRAASTGEGIVTAFMLSNPALGEEISFQITGRDPHTVLTEYYKHPMPEERQQQSWSVGGQKREGKGTWMTTSVPALHWPSMPSGISLESITTRGRKFKDMLLHKTSDNNNNGRVDQSNNPDTVKRLEDVTYEADEVYPSLEKSHYLKKSTTENDLVYKIEWTPKKIEWTVNGQILRTLRPEDLPLHRHTRQKLQIPSQPMQIQITVWDAGHSPDTTAWAGGKTNYGTENEKEYVALVDWIEIACYDNKEAKRNPWPGKDALARLAQAEEEERKAEAEQEALRKTKNSEDKNTLKATEDSIKEATKVSTGWLSFLSSRKSSESDQAEPKNKKQLKKEAKQQKEEARQQKKEAKQQKKQAEKEKKQKQEKARAARKPGAISMFMDRLIRVLLRWNFIVLFLVAIGSYLTEPINDHQSRLKAHKEKLGMQQ